jgi:hypothetical protein
LKRKRLPDVVLVLEPILGIFFICACFIKLLQFDIEVGAFGTLDDLLCSDILQIVADVPLDALIE